MSEKQSPRKKTSSKKAKPVEEVVEAPEAEATSTAPEDNPQRAHRARYTQEG